MLEIDKIINSVTSFFGSFSKLNGVEDRSVRTFFKILLSIAIALFLGKLFLRDDLYDKILDHLSDPITFSVIIGLAMIVYSYFAHLRMTEVMTKVIKEVEEKNNDEKIRNMGQRRENSPKIYTEITKLLYSCNATRVVVSEYHNGCANSGGLDFEKYDETYEEVNENRPMPYISKNYTDMKTSLYKITSYLRQNNIFVGSTTELNNIDKRYAANMDADNIGYIAVVEIHNRKDENKPIGMLALCWKKGEEKYIPDTHILQEKLMECEIEVRNLLTFTR